MLKLDIRQNPPRSIWLVTKVTVGKDSQNDIILNVPGVEDFHVMFHLDGDTVYLTDKSKQGTFLNGERVVERTAIQSGDSITVGEVVMDIIDPKQAIIENTNEPKVNSERWILRAITGWLAGQEIVIDDAITLGRDKSCDVTIPGTHLSRHHAQITVQGNKLHIKDLGSTNGTFLNGERIDEADVVPGDEVRFDLLSFFVLGPATSAQTQESDRLFVSKAMQYVEVDTNPAVRVGEAKPTSLGNSDEYVKAYNEQLAALKAQKKQQSKNAKRDAILGWVIVIGVMIALVWGIIHWTTH